MPAKAPRKAAKKTVKKSAKKTAKAPARKGAARKAAKAPARKKATKTPAKRAGGRPGTGGKAEGDAPVEAYIASLSGWQRDAARRFDAIIAREVPDVKRAVKWSAPFYGREGMGWFASFGAFTKHVKLNFFRGTSLKPVPPSGASKQMRALDVRGPEEFDEAQVADWVRQAARIPGWTA